MKKYLLLLFIFLSSMQVNAQADNVKCTFDINEQVWKPFIKYFISGNNEGFRNLHSKRISRVEIDRNKILDYEKYFPSVDSPSQAGKKNLNRLFELRFDKRICNGTRAWETGYYKGTITQEGKEPRSYYGRFFVVLEKENNEWKILVDADTGKEANEENFSKASSLE